MELQIDKALDKARQAGIKITGADLARALWPDSKSANYSLWKLKSGKANFIKISHVKTICDMCGVDANFLFNIQTK